MLTFIRAIIPYIPTYESIKQKPTHPLLPRKKRGSHRFTLVLDLDETLAHCSCDPMLTPDHTIEITANQVNYKVRKCSYKLYR